MLKFVIVMLHIFHGIVTCHFYIHIVCTGHVDLIVFPPAFDLYDKSFLVWLTFYM